MIQNVVKSYGSITIVRVFSRIFQFILKAYLIRTVLSQQVVAHMINLNLVLTASLHIVKSCLKPSYQKVQDHKNSVKSGMNVMSFGVLSTFCCAAVFCWWELYSYFGSGKVLAYFQYAIILYGISAVMESLAEKYFVDKVLKYEYLKIGKIQVISLLPKSIFIFIAAKTDILQTYGILTFGVGQLIYSSMLFSLSFLNSTDKSILLQRFGNKQNQNVLFDKKSEQSMKQFSMLSILKFVLQQFQSIILVLMDVSKISSIYVLISNLGSIVVRYLYAPLQEIVYNFFSRGDKQESLKTFLTFVKFLVTFSVLAVSFGYNYSESFLLFLYGQKWVNQESVLAMRTYCLLLGFMGLNGIFEAFTFARGKQSVSKYKYFSIPTTIIYLASSYAFLFSGMGAAGLFMGNIMNMNLRIGVCWLLQIRNHISLKKFISQVIPSRPFLLLSSIIFFACSKEIGVIQSIFKINLLTLALGGIMFVSNLCPIMYEHRTLIIDKLKSFFMKSHKQ